MVAAMVALVSAIFLFSLQQGALGARMLSARVAAELPPCKDVPGGTPWFDCTPPFTPLPPCDYNHQNPGIDCWLPKPPATETHVPAAGGASTHGDGKSTSTHEVGGRHHVEGELPPCKDVPGGIPGFDCFDPPTVPLPPCDFRHQRPGFDCWPPT